MLAVTMKALSRLVSAVTLMLPSSNGELCGPVGSGVVEVEVLVPELQEQRMLSKTTNEMTGIVLKYLFILPE
jgi:hypothetical protein